MSPIAKAGGTAIMESASGIRFEDQATEKSMIGLDACIRDMTQAGWKHHPYQEIGNFWEAKWCRGKGARDDCQIASSSAARPDQHAIRLYTLFYPQTFPTMFGLGLSVLYTPPAGGIGCSIYFAENGKTIVGEGFSLMFTDYEKDNPKPGGTVELRHFYRYQVHETWVELKSEKSQREDFQRYIRSPESMRDHGLDRLESLLKKVVTVIESHQAEGCDYGPYEGDGVPPICNVRPLTPQEEKDALARVHTDIGSRIEFLKQNYKAMHETMLKAFPLQSCFK